ncbi:MAG: carbon-nitrogen hydrolase family protein, partial [Bacteroidota bacterium]
MKIAAAQISAQVGALDQNLNKHLHLIELAAEHQVELLLFPEMSLTGYTRAEGEKVDLGASDPRVEALRQEAVSRQMTIIAGAPIKMADKLYIGAFILSPDGQTHIYTKQYLHDGEEQFYAASFAHNPIPTIGKERMALAI